MADPPVTPLPTASDTDKVEKNTQALNDNTASGNSNAESLKKQADAAFIAEKARIDYAKTLAITTNAQLNDILLSDRSVLAFDLVSQAVMGAGTAYNKFDDAMKNTQSFSTQVDSMLRLVKTGSIVGGSLETVAKAMGLPAAAISKGGTVLETLIRQTAAGADQSLKLQMGFVGMMGATGGLPLLFDKAGGSLENLNAMMATQQEGIVQLAGATGLTTAQITPFYKMMGESIPGALGESASLTEKSARQFDDLKGAMQLASGTGRDTTAIITDMKSAWDHYGLSGEKARQFTSRMSELSGKFGINLEYTSKFIKDNASAFERISTKADNGANSFNRWFTALKGTGVSAKVASEMIGEMEKKMSTLTVAQKAFLSAQSGGIGGLRGAAQIEGLLKEGKTDEIMAMAEKAIKKQFGGKIVDLADAQKSEQAAGEFFKQKQMLQSGAFGGLAKNDQTAARLLEAMKAGTSTKDALSPDGALSASMKSGEELQKTSNTILTSLENIAQRQLAVSSGTSLAEIQKIAGGENLAKNIKGGMATKVEDYRSQAMPKLSETASKIQAGETVDVNKIRSENLDELFKFVPEKFKNLFYDIRGKVLSSDKGKQAQGKAALDQVQRKGVTLPGMKKSEPMFSQLVQTPAASTKPAVLGSEAYVSPGEKKAPSPLAHANIGERYVPRAMATSAAVNKSTAATSKVPAWLEASEKAKEAASATEQARPAPNTKVDVTVKGLCIKCARTIQPDPHNQSINGGT